ncbi:MAG: tetratricopeptide repeat protein, partial [Elusimicrobiota bacterium]
ARFVVKRMSEASEDFTAAAAADPKYALAHFGLGSVLSSQNRPKDALKHLNRAVELAPDAAVVRVVRGTVRDKLRDFAGAAVDYTAVLRVAPAFEWAHYYRGRAYRELRKYPESVEDFTAFLRKNPDHEDALYLRSNAYFLLNDQDRAVKDLDHILSVNPSHGLAFANRGVARSEMGDMRGALSDLRKAKVLLPAKAAKIEEQIQRLSGGGDAVAMDGELTGVAAQGSLPQEPLPSERDLSR